jgi:hypothetical protein
VIPETGDAVADIPILAGKWGESAGACERVFWDTWQKRKSLTVILAGELERGITTGYSGMPAGFAGPEQHRHGAAYNAPRRP